MELDVDTACILARGSCSRTLTPRDGRLEFAPMLPGLPVRKDLPVREDCGYIRPGAATSVLPFCDRPVIGSHLLRSAVSRVFGLWMPHLLFGLQPWTLLGDFRLSGDPCWWYTIKSGTDLPVVSDRLYDFMIWIVILLT